MPHDVLALLVASLTHDLDHPANTNAFEIASASPLALLYNDVHVLECLAEGTALATCTADADRTTISVDELREEDIARGLSLQGQDGPVPLLSVRHGITSHDKFVVADAEGRVHAVTPNHRVTLVWAWGPRAARHEPIAMSTNNSMRPVRP